MLGHPMVWGSALLTATWMYTHPDAVQGLCDTWHNEGVEDEVENNSDTENDSDDDHRHSPDRQALNDLLNDLTNNGRRPLSPDNGDAAIDLGNELGIPGVRDDRNTDHWVGGPHIHIPQTGVGDGAHIPALPR